MVNALLTAVIATAIGAPPGIVSGYFRGHTDDFLMRITDMFMAFPRLILAMGIPAALRPTLENAVGELQKGFPAYLPGPRRCTRDRPRRPRAAMRTAVSTVLMALARALKGMMTGHSSAATFAGASPN